MEKNMENKQEEILESKQKDEGEIIDEKILGSAYCLIFWVQNIGLCLVPLLIGVVLNATGGYLMPMIIFSSFGVLAFIFSLLLKVEDKRKGFGLEKPNIER